MALIPNQFLPLQIQRIDYQPPLEWSENPQCMMSSCDILYYRITDDQERAICPVISRVSGYPLCELDGSRGEP